MNARNRVQIRAEAIYDYLLSLNGDGVTLPDMCTALGFEGGSTTRTAISRARDMATAEGLHFPPAVPANGMTYRVTSLPGDALDPTLHMARIEDGVRRRKDDGMDFMRRLEKELPPDLRPIAKAFLAINDKTTEAIAGIRRAADEMAIELVKLRRHDRSRDEVHS